ncbi:MAG: GNAT family N-acetyltransferase [Promethearchaeota archaeon]
MQKEIPSSNKSNKDPNEYQKIEIRAVKPEEEREVKLVMARAFHKGEINANSEINIPDFIEQEIEDKEFFRAVFLNGKAVSALKIIPFELEIENIWLKLWGLTGVATDPAFQGHGYASMLLQDVFKLAFKRGIDLIILHSAADMLYRKNGFGFGFCSFESSIKLPNNLYKNNLIEKINQNIANLEKRRLNIELKNKNTYAIKPKLNIEHINLKEEDIKDELIKKIVELRNKSFIYKKRRVKSPLSIKLLKFLIKYFLKSRQVYISTIKRNNDLSAYVISIIRNYSELEIDEQYYRDNIIDILRIWKNLLNEIKIPIAKIKIKTYPEFEEMNKYIEKIFGKIYKIFLTGNMAYIVNPNNLLKKFLPIFEKRIDSLKNANHQEVNFVLEIRKNSNPKELVENARFLFKIKNSKIQIINFRNDEDIGFLNGKTPITIPILQEEFVGLLLGYLSVEDLESFDNLGFFNSCNSKNSTLEMDLIKKILKILFPQIQPVWEHLYFY